MDLAFSVVIARSIFVSKQQVKQTFSWRNIMSEIQKVNPIVCDGIEYYVSNDGRQTGMSIRGIARFIGVDHKAIMKLLDNVNVSTLGTTDIPNCLKPFAGACFAWGLEADNGAKIIPSAVCTAVIHYYAFESTRVSEDVKAQALDAYNRFAQFGMHEFIKRQTGFVDRMPIEAMTQELWGLVNKLKHTNEELEAFGKLKSHTATFMPGARNLIDEIIEGDYVPHPDEVAMNIRDWLDSVGVKLSYPKYCAFARMTAEAVKSITKQDLIKCRFRNPKKSKSRWSSMNVYEPHTFPILQMCLEKVISGRKY